MKATNMSTFLIIVHVDKLENAKRIQRVK